MELHTHPSLPKAAGTPSSGKGTGARAIVDPRFEIADCAMSFVARGRN